ncbi:M28 family peptidase [Sphingosinicella microcystinivorans]|uniref:M28 family peptidase n=1 Tax=Sphingosinicella microcystinivorans TaxID=335406 RepID=UPI0022F3ED03|nr:M28 family peptidase [Sphingosinicella microcystinivorans]WBX84200.1 M28 family peptidase [Sphingosinicella microcystinivorans]
MAGWKAWSGLAICMALLALWTLRPIGVHPPGSIETAFDTERAIGRLAVILGDQRPHPTDSEANDAVEQRLLAEIRKAGFAPLVRERFHCNAIREGAAICARPRNILFWVTPPGDDAVMLAAHYDSVPAGPGAADDGIGIAVILEVAHLLKGRDLARPVLVLLSDAEEAGLVGAAAFAAHDPLRAQVGAVVNVEARGTTGGVNMFQTSRPNAHDLDALIAGGQMASANALATDFYELLPNDTDLTMFLPMGVDAANYSIIGAGKRYHTPLDDLSHLDVRSVRHMGASVLAAATGFAETRPKGAEGERVFTDLDRKVTLVLPHGAAVVLLGLGAAAAAVVFLRAGRGGRRKAMLLPPLALIAGVGASVAVGALIAALRADAAFGTAYPAVLRLAFAAAALAGAGLVVHLMRAENPSRSAASAWIWISVPILAAFVFIPGLSILAAWPLVAVIAAAAASCFAPSWRFVVLLLAVAAVLFTVIALPLAGGLEEGLFIENSAPVSALLVLMLLLFMPLHGPRSHLVPAVCAVIALGATLAALTVPAYTRGAPRHLSVVHEDADGKAAFLVENNGPIPESMKAVADFADTPDDNGNWHAPAPAIVDDGTVEVRFDSTLGDERKIVIAVDSPLADRQEFLIAKGGAIRSVTVNGTRPDIRGIPAYVGCTGRSCRRMEIALLLASNGPLPEIRWRRTRYALGEGMKRLVESRPDTAQPVHVGDRQVLVRTIGME